MIYPAIHQPECLHYPRADMAQSSLSMQVRSFALVSFIVISFSGVDGWWIWGEDEEAAAVQGDGEAKVEGKVVGENGEDTASDLLNTFVKTAVEKEKEAIKEDVNDEKNIPLGTPELAKKLDREAFEQKLDEVIKYHESLHLNKESHFDPNGEHNDEYDHEVGCIYKSSQ